MAGNTSTIKEMCALAAASQPPLAATSVASQHQQQNFFDLSRYRQYNLAQQFLSQQQGAVTKLLGEYFIIFIFA